jgi:endonuclease YncB( thermonuclease family)
MRSDRWGLVIGIVGFIVGLGAAFYDDVTTFRVPESFVACDVQRVVDGDTIEITICTYIMPNSIRTGGVYRPFMLYKKVRALDYDAWESAKHARSTGPVVTDAEVVRGKKAAVALTELLGISLKQPPHVYLMIDKYKEDSFGRILAPIYIEKDGKLVSVAKWMKDRGHTRSE